MSLLGHKRTNHRRPKSNFVRCYSNNGQTRACLECPLCANHVIRCTAEESGLFRSLEQTNFASYRSESGVSPAFKITCAASGDARKRSSALAASGCRAERVSAPAKKVGGWTEAGIVPTKVMPGTCISSATCWKPISASPRGRNRIVR